MLVETFECPETAAEPIEASEEAIRLIEEMGLEGQKSLSVTRDGNPTRCPYREIRADERFVYQTICPVSEKLAAYDSAPIPLRVLQVAAHAKSLGMFNQLIVWSQADAAVKDPVLVATTGRYEWSADKTFILARWGEELETFAVLVKRAVAMVRERLVQEARAMVSKLETTPDAELIELGPNRHVGV